MKKWLKLADKSNPKELFDISEYTIYSLFDGFDGFLVGKLVGF